LLSATPTQRTITDDDAFAKRGSEHYARVHLGHYAGALENWLKLQETYDCQFLIADYQVSDYADDVAPVRDAVWEVALDWLAVGLDPQRSAFVIESLVPEHAELMVWLSWLLPLGMLQRNPTLKSEMEDFGRRSVPVAFFTYPMMQVTNILLPRADLVPVGEDQLPHLELTREIARRFNRQFPARVSRAGGFGGPFAPTGGNRRVSQDEQIAG